VCCVCGTVCCGFVGSECALCVVHIRVGLRGVFVCCVWKCSSGFVESDCVLCVGQFFVGLWGVIVRVVWDSLLLV